MVKTVKLIRECSCFVCWHKLRNNSFNAVFVATDARRAVTGAERVGTRTRSDGGRFRGLARGSRKARGSFWIPVDGEPPETVLLAESAIDALSLRTLRQGKDAATVFLSTAGVCNAVPEWVETWNPKRIVAAFDADPVGDRAAEILAAGDPRVSRLRPQGGKDWNEVLVNRLASEARASESGALPPS